MIVGDPSILAIESHITHAFERLSLRALGFFVLHVGGLSYGRRSADSTMLANSFDEVRNRLAMRGAHVVPFVGEADAGSIADAFRNAIYGEHRMTSYFGIPLPQFSEMFYSKQIIWAPDGDAAFDDGSYVLQFDVKDCVRVVAFKSAGYSYDPATLRDMYLAADDFYPLLQKWSDGFESEWASLPKQATQ